MHERQPVNELLANKSLIFKYQNAVQHPIPVIRLSRFFCIKDK